MSMSKPQSNGPLRGTKDNPRLGPAAIGILINGSYDDVRHLMETGQLPYETDYAGRRSSLMSDIVKVMRARQKQPRNKRHDFTALLPPDLRHSQGEPPPKRKKSR